MRLGIGLLCLVWAQTAPRCLTYGGSELLRHRYHRNYIPPLFMSSGFAGISYTWRSSGQSYRLRGWAEGRLALPMIGSAGLGRLQVIPGATMGLGFQVGLPEPDQLYVQLSPGIDMYWMQVGDPSQTTFSTDWQVRPIIIAEVGFPARDDYPFFVRYGFYPAPGTTSRMVIGFGTYFRP